MGESNELSVCCGPCNNGAHAEFGLLTIQEEEEVHTHRILQGLKYNFYVCHGNNLYINCLETY